jgi:positive regulator of sigma E activity
VPRVTGVVTAVEAGIARVECSPAGPPACAVCASGRGCGWQRPSRPRHLEIDAMQAGRRLEPGQRLELEVDDRRLLRAAGRLYLPPLIGVLAGPVALRMAGLEQGLLPLFAAALGLAVGAVVARRWTRMAVPVQLRPPAASNT